MMKIQCNVGTLDRALHSTIGSLMIYVGFIGESLVIDAVTGLILGVFGAIVLLSAIVCNCPLYMLEGFNTCATADKD